MFDDENATNTKGALGWNASAATPTDPTNANFHLRSADASLSNLSAHTYYQVAFFASWLFLIQQGTTNYNYAPWNTTESLFDTEVPPTYAWGSGWQPRDPTTPGAQTTLTAGTIAGAPLPAVIVSPDQLGKSGIGAGQTRPGYTLPDIAAGSSQSFTQVLRIERPTNNGAYAYTEYRVVSARTCLPAPTIAPATVGDSSIHGTGTTAGDVVTVTDQEGNVLGSATVQADLTWNLTLTSPVAATVTTLTATAVDEFSLEGQAHSTVSPLPIPPSITSPSSVTLSCSGDAVFSTTVTAGTPAPTLTWEQSTNGGTTWAPADGTTSTDGLSLTVAAAPEKDGTLLRARATNSAGSVVSQSALLTVESCSTPTPTPAPTSTSTPTPTGGVSDGNASNGNGHSSLAITGGSSLPTVLAAGAGVLLAAGGVLLTVLVRRRRNI